MATLIHRDFPGRVPGRFLLFPILLLWLAGLGVFSGKAQDDKKVVSEVFTYGAVPRSEVEQTVKSLLTKDGKYVVLPEKQTIMVQDVKERVDMIGAVLADMSKPQPNVRIELSFQEISGDRSGGIQVNGNVGGRDVRVGNRPYPRDGITINAGSTSITRSSSSGQFLIVQGGQSASIEVASKVPFVDYFYNYANYLGLPVPAVRWESVGTRMSVHPEVQGDQIRVEVVPEISALSGGRWQILSIRQLATVVTVPNGMPVQIGGFQSAGDEFNRNFFSRGASQGASSSTFTLKATIQ